MEQGGGGRFPSTGASLLISACKFGSGPVSAQTVSSEPQASISQESVWHLAGKVGCVCSFVFLNHLKDIFEKFESVVVELLLTPCPILCPRCEGHCCREMGPWHFVGGWATVAWTLVAGEGGAAWWRLSRPCLRMRLRCIPGGLWILQDALGTPASIP